MEINVPISTCIDIHRQPQTHKHAYDYRHESYDTYALTCSHETYTLQMAFPFPYVPGGLFHSPHTAYPYPYPYIASLAYFSIPCTWWSVRTVSTQCTHIHTIHMVVCPHSLHLVYPYPYSHAPGGLSAQSPPGVLISIFSSSITPNHV